MAIQTKVTEHCVALNWCCSCVPFFAIGFCFSFGSLTVKVVPGHSNKRGITLTRETCTNCEYTDSGDYKKEVFHRCLCNFEEAWNACLLRAP